MRRNLDVFYTSLAATVSTALPLTRALASAGRPDLAPLADGRPLADILAAGGYPDIDVAVIRAAETSGRTEAALRTLARRAREAEMLRRRIKAIRIYPMALAHAALIVPFVIGWIFHGGSAWPLLMDLAGLWIGFFLIRAVLASAVGEALPVIGPVRRDVALARFCDALAGSLDAALPIPRAVAFAADAAGGSTGRRARAVADFNRPLVESLATVLPPLSLEMLRAGEEAGSTDKALAKLGQRHFEDAVHGLNKIVAILPVVLFLAAGALAAVQIFATGIPVLTSRGTP